MQHIGKASISFDNTPYIQEYASIVGKKEGEGPLGKYFDEINEDSLFGGDNWEDAESRLIESTISKLLSKANMSSTDIDYILSGDLLGQLIASSFGLVNFNIPLFGLYGACSTFGEAVSLGSVLVASGAANRVIASASSHFASAEKTFRFPLGYGNQRKFSATWTTTGCGSVIISKDTGKVKITGITTGKIVDYGLKDKENMGACMAPAAADTIYNNLCDFGRNPSDYDKIFTGDLGYIGQTILIDLLREKGIDISDVHSDCGIEIFDINLQDTHAGGSGCGCSASTFCSYIMKQFEAGKFKRILLVPTGALLSPTSSNEGNSVPGIAHGVVFEAV
ncbi:MAG: stage V sporulation protein AD [Lachnospiraceae bacterium]|nr:stage V sporulation protein AD [Lachnospiraceae bacterium]MDE6698730.1 stage V sporulation protein AD [Lachnospiraceae bacterium]